MSQLRVSRGEQDSGLAKYLLSETPGEASQDDRLNEKARSSSVRSPRRARERALANARGLSTLSRRPSGQISSVYAAKLGFERGGFYNLHAHCYQPSNSLPKWTPHSSLTPLASWLHH